MPTKANVLDAVALSLIGTVWLLVPAHLEQLHRPFSAVASASLVEMPIVLLAAFLWCFLVSGRTSPTTNGGGLGGRFLFFAFMAYFWSLIDDGPVDFDSVLTWPEVTGGPQHIFLEVLLHALTLGFLFLALREALKGRYGSNRNGLSIGFLGLMSFWASYFQNTPFAGLEDLPAKSWYALDAVEHLTALALLWMAVRESRRREAPAQIPGGSKE
jgi:hypothetical protein